MYRNMTYGFILGALITFLVNPPRGRYSWEIPYRKGDGVSDHRNQENPISNPIGYVWSKK